MIAGFNRDAQQTRLEPARVPSPPTQSYSLCFSTDSSLLAVTRGDTGFMVWNIASEKCIISVLDIQVDDIAFSADDSTILTSKNTNHFHSYSSLIMLFAHSW